MKRLALSAAAAALLLSACSSSVDEPQEGGAEDLSPVSTDDESAQDDDAVLEEPGEDEVESRTFVAREGIPVTLTLASSDDGGRRNAYFDGYRPEVVFDGQEAIHCAFGVPEGAGDFSPGETGDIEISCTEDVTIEPDALDFTVIEGGREVGSGVVRLADAQ